MNRLTAHCYTWVGVVWCLKTFRQGRRFGDQGGQTDFVFRGQMLLASTYVTRIRDVCISFKSANCILRCGNCEVSLVCVSN
jgi:hypothetical protein